MNTQEAMNPTVEEAIRRLEGMVFTYDLSPETLREIAVNKMCLAALREQEEQKTGCAFCDEEHDEHDYMNGIQTLENGKYLVLETSEWDDYDDCFYDIRIAANFCPMCGRKLKGDGRERD